MLSILSNAFFFRLFRCRHGAAGVFSTNTNSQKETITYRWVIQMIRLRCVGLPTCAEHGKQTTETAMSTRRSRWEARKHCNNSSCGHLFRELLKFWAGRLRVKMYLPFQTCGQPCLKGSQRWAYPPRCLGGMSWALTTKFQLRTCKCYTTESVAVVVRRNSIGTIYALENYTGVQSPVYVKKTVLTSIDCLVTND